MNVQFGFLGSTEVFSAEIPDHMDPAPFLVTVIDIEGKSLETMVYEHIDKFDPSSNPELAYRYDTQDDGRTVSVYERPDEPRFLVPFWHITNGYLRTQFSTDVHGEGGLQKVLDGVSPYLDQNGFLRVALSGSIGAGDIREEPQRDQVGFLSTLATAVPLSVRFGYSGAFGHDDSKHWQETCMTTRTTEVGVTVTCEGLAENRQGVEDAAEAAASTTQRRS